MISPKDLFLMIDDYAEHIIDERFYPILRIKDGGDTHPDCLLVGRLTPDRDEIEFIWLEYYEDIGFRFFGHCPAIVELIYKTGKAFRLPVASIHWQYRFLTWSIQCRNAIGSLFHIDRIILPLTPDANISVHGSLVGPNGVSYLYSLLSPSLLEPSYSYDTSGNIIPSRRSLYHELFDCKLIANQDMFDAYYTRVSKLPISLTSDWLLAEYARPVLDDSRERAIARCIVGNAILAQSFPQTATDPNNLMFVNAHIYVTSTRYKTWGKH